MSENQQSVVRTLSTPADSLFAAGIPPAELALLSVSMPAFSRVPFGDVTNETNNILDISAMTPAPTNILDISTMTPAPKVASAQFEASMSFSIDALAASTPYRRGSMDRIFESGECDPIAENLMRLFETPDVPTNETPNISTSSAASLKRPPPRPLSPEDQPPPKLRICYPETLAQHIENLVKELSNEGSLIHSQRLQLFRGLVTYLTTCLESESLEPKRLLEKEVLCFSVHALAQAIVDLEKDGDNIPVLLESAKGSKARVSHQVPRWLIHGLRKYYLEARPHFISDEGTLVIYIGVLLFIKKK